MLEAFFSSRVRVRLLTAFLMKPDLRSHARALVGTVGASYNAVWKELNNLERAGFLLSESGANIKSYWLNPRFPILPELRAIILKTAGAGDTIRHALADFQVQAAFVYGSFAADSLDSASDIDVMIVGKVDLTRLGAAVAKLEKELGRVVNYVIYTPEEWCAKQAEQDPFVSNVLAGFKIMLIGAEDGLRRPGAGRAYQAVPSASRGDQAVAASCRARPRHRRTKSR